MASVALLFGAMGMAVAQNAAATTEEVVSEEVTNARRYEVGTFADNWFLGIGGGVNQYLGEHDRQMKFFNRLAPAAEIYAGKWFTPVVGFRIGYRGLQAYGATNVDTGFINSTGTPVSPDHLTDDFLGDYDGYVGDGSDHKALYWQKFGFYNIHADFMLNLVNLIGGYKERVYNISVYGGVGLARTYSATKVETGHVANTRISGSVGLFNTFNLSPALDLNIDLRGTLFPEDFEGEAGVRPEGGETYEADGMLTASIGLAYKFKPRGWSQSKTVYRTRTNTVKVVDDAALSALKADNEALQKALAEAEKNTTTTIVESLLAPELYIRFAFNKSELTGEARITLGNLAKLLNATDKHIVYNITGYADSATGTAEGNQALSEARAKAVYDCLVNEHGVDPSHLTMEAKGGVEAMFYDDNTLSRAAILTLQK